MVGSYLNPPGLSLVFSSDEKTRSALHRTQPSLPMKRGRPTVTRLQRERREGPPGSQEYSTSMSSSTTFGSHGAVGRQAQPAPTLQNDEARADLVKEIEGGPTPCPADSSAPTSPQRD